MGRCVRSGGLSGGFARAGGVLRSRSVRFWPGRLFPFRYGACRLGTREELARNRPTLGQVVRQFGCGFGLLRPLRPLFPAGGDSQYHHSYRYQYIENILHDNSVLCVYEPFYALYSLYLADAVHHRVQAFGILDVEADRPFEYAVVALDGDFADVDAEVAADDLRQVEQDAHAVDAAQGDRREVVHGLVLRPLDLLLHDLLPVLGGQPVQFVARGFVDDDLAAFGVAEADYAVARNGLAALRDDELRFGARGDRILCRALSRVVALLLPLFLWDEERPELQQFLGRAAFQDLLQVVEPDDSRADLAVELLFVRAAVGRHDLAQYPAAQVDVQPLHAFLEHLYASLDVVLLLALEEALDGLLGLACGYRVQPLGLGTGIVGRDDFDLVAAVELRSQRFDLVVDLRSDGVVADLGVNLVGEIQCGGAEGQFAGLTLRGKHHDFRCIER